MTDLLKKYNLLDKASKREILDFTDFLLNKNMKSSKNNMIDYKKKIINVSTWTESDIEFISKNQKKFNQWKIQEW